MFAREQFFAVQSHEVAAYWEHLLPVLLAIEDETDQVTAEDVLRQAASGQAQLWAYAEDGRVVAVAATRVHEMSRGKLCTIWVAVGFGHLGIFNDAHAEIENWARSIGCYAIEIVGRPGWMRALPGYHRKAVVIEKPLQKVH